MNRMLIQFTNALVINLDKLKQIEIVSYTDQEGFYRDNLGYPVPNKIVTFSLEVNGKQIATDTSGRKMRNLLNAILAKMAYAMDRNTSEDTLIICDLIELIKNKGETK